MPAEGPRVSADGSRVAAEGPRESAEGTSLAAGTGGEGDRGQAFAPILLDRALRQLVYGQSFDAKIRQRVWTAGREVIGVGSYEQAGHGSGQFNLQVTMHDGDGKHTLQQISDGKLAWTRAMVAGEVTLKRVNLGALDESLKRDRGWNGNAWYDMVRGAEVENARQQTGSTSGPIPSRLLVGGIVEMLERIGRDYELHVSGGRLQGEAVWILAGQLRHSSRSRILDEAGRQDWPELCPSHVRVAVAATPDRETGFGAGLPIRLEFWSDPLRPNSRSSSDERAAGEQAGSHDEAEGNHPSGRLISLIELYSIQPIDRPLSARFKFVTEEYAVHFVDETERYSGKRE